MNSIYFLEQVTEEPYLLTQWLHFNLTYLDIEGDSSHHRSSFGSVAYLMVLCNKVAGKCLLQHSPGCTGHGLLYIVLDLSVLHL